MKVFSIWMEPGPVNAIRRLSHMRMTFMGFTLKDPFNASLGAILNLEMANSTLDFSLINLKLST